MFSTYHIPSNCVDDNKHNSKFKILIMTIKIIETMKN